MSKPLPGQLDLFTTPAREGRGIELNSTVLLHDARRLTAAVHRLADRLREGKATNVELMQIAGARFSARLGEARDNGLIKGWKKRHVDGGVWEYELIGE